jgi:hypothetical protein
MFSSATTRNVMLALFEPSGSGSRIIRDPVSLIDVAPTIRKLMQMPERASDGRPLPDGTGIRDPDRTITSMPVKSLEGVLNVVGLSAKPISSNLIGTLAHLRNDGSFDYTPSFIQEVEKKLCCVGH